MKKILLFLFFIGVAACKLGQEKGIPFKIVNTSDLTLTNIKVSTSENLDSVTFDTLSSQESREGFLAMEKNTTDGAYTLAYTIKDGSTKGIASGYYTNGGTLDNYIRFEIQNDTTLVTFGEFPR